MTRNCDKCDVRLSRDVGNICYKCQYNVIVLEAPLISEVLMYADFHRKSATKKKLVNTMCGFFTDVEIKRGKSLLYDRFGAQNILQNGVARRGTDNRTELMAIYCDIVDDLSKLEEKEIPITCCATNWKRIPRINPEEISNISMADKLGQLEAKFALYESALSDIRVENSLMDNRVAKIEKREVVGNREWPQLQSPQQHTSKHVTGNGMSRDATLDDHDRSTPRTQRTYGGGAHNRRDDRSDYRRVDREDPGTQQRDHVPANPYSRDSYGSRERRYARDSRFSRDVRYKDHSINDKSNGSRFTGRRNAIMGQSTSGNLRGGELPVRDFFVSRVHKDDGVEQMRNFLQGKDIEVRDVVLKSANDAKFNSFKLSVSVDDADKVMDPILWGRGVRVTRWRKFDN